MNYTKQSRTGKYFDMPSGYCPLTGIASTGIRKLTEADKQKKREQYRMKKQLKQTT